MCSDSEPAAQAACCWPAANTWGPTDASLHVSHGGALLAPSFRAPLSTAHLRPTDRSTYTRPPTAPHPNPTPAPRTPSPPGPPPSGPHLPLLLGPHPRLCRLCLLIRRLVQQPSSLAQPRQHGAAHGVGVLPRRVLARKQQAAAHGLGQRVIVLARGAHGNERVAAARVGLCVGCGQARQRSARQGWAGPGPGRKQALQGGACTQRLLPPEQEHRIAGPGRERTGGPFGRSVGGGLGHLHARVDAPQHRHGRLLELLCRLLLRSPRSGPCRGRQAQCSSGSALIRRRACRGARSDGSGAAGGGLWAVPAGPSLGLP